MEKLKFGDFLITIIDVKKLFCKTIILIAILIFIIGSLSAAASSGDISVNFDGTFLKFDQNPIIVNSRTMVPLRTVFEAYGAEVSWDEGTEIITSKLDDIEIILQIDNNEMFRNGKVIHLDAAPMIEGDRTLVPVRAISESFGSEVTWDDINRIVCIRNLPESNKVMNGTIISDEYRYENYDGQYNGVSIFNKNGTDYFGMELLGISKKSGEKYAEMLNGMAEDLPDVRVFCGVVPTAAEFYAPFGFRTNYLSAISHIYNNLDSNVTPINIENAMMSNADKYIYFKTDHHWTHLGSYFAYREFCSVSGNMASELDQFEKRTINNYLGSWGKVTVDTDGYNMLDSSRDIIEFYMPKVEFEGQSYSEMEMDKPTKNMQLINPAFGNYAIFLEGDNPLEYYHTNVDNGKSICIIKESFGNAFSTWLLNNYENVYIVDYRIFNNNGENYNTFTVKEFYDMYNFDDLLVLSYPYTIQQEDLRQMLGQTWRLDYVEYSSYSNDNGSNDNDVPLPTLVPDVIDTGLE